jgi:hypothetical protein
MTPCRAGRVLRYPLPRSRSPPPRRGHRLPAHAAARIAPTSACGPFGLFGRSCGDRGSGNRVGMEWRSRRGRWKVSIPGTYTCRWAPCERAHGLSQGQLPRRSIRPRGIEFPVAPGSLAGMQCSSRKTAPPVGSTPIYAALANIEWTLQYRVKFMSSTGAPAIRRCSTVSSMPRSVSGDVLSVVTHWSNFSTRIR